MAMDMWHVGRAGKRRRAAAAVVVVVAGMLCIAQARAESPAEPPEVPSLADLSTQLTQAIAFGVPQAAKKKKEMDQDVAENEKDKGKSDFWFGEFSKYAAPVAAFKTDKEKFLADSAAYEARRLEHGARCSGELDDAASAACEAESIASVGETRELDRRNTQLLQRSAELQKIVVPIKAELDKLNQRMKERLARWEQDKKTYDELTAKLEKHRSSLGQVCGTAQDIADTDEDGLEALHHCMSVGWDKKTRSLPRLVVMLVRGLPGLKVESNQ